jgi:cell division initiation protein
LNISSFDIQNKQFRVKIRGFDIQEVDQFLEEMAAGVEVLQSHNKALKEEVKRLERENKSHKEREDTLNNALFHSQQVMEQMKENAQKTADVVIADAEVKAEKILNNAHHRLSQLHEDIAELKRQRIQIEIQIGSVIESHSKLLEMSKAEREEKNDEDAKVKLLKQTYS